MICKSQLSLRFAYYVISIWVALSGTSCAEDVTSIVQPILDASQKSFVEFVQRAITVPLPPLPSPSQAEANKQLSEVSFLLWRRLSALDLRITPESKAEQMDTIKAMCSLHKWLMLREGYTNLLLASCIQDMVSKAIIAALADGSVTVDDAWCISTLTQQMPSADAIVSVFEQCVPDTQVIRDYREGRRTKPHNTSIFALGLLLQDQRPEAANGGIEGLLSR